MERRRYGWIVGAAALMVAGLGMPWGWAEDETTSQTTQPEAQTAQPDAQAPSSDQPAADAPTDSQTPTATQETSTPTQETSEPSSADAPTASQEASPTPPATAAPAPGFISIDFKDADIRQVLRVISLKSGVDIVAGSDVEGLVTIKLTNVPWQQALDIILRTYGFSYEQKGSIVRVMSKDALDKEALSTEVFPLDYAKAKEIPEILGEMLSDRGKVKFDERTNTIIVTDIPTSLFQIKEVIKRLDQRTPQVLIEAKVVETKLEEDENLGIDWSDSIKLTQTIPALSSTFPYPAGSGLGSVGTAFGTARIPERSAATSFTLGTLTSDSLTATLNFLHKRTDTHIISNPSVAVLNNHEAKIHVGQEYPIPNYSIDPSTGNTTISGYTSKDTGTVMTVTPHINPSSEIVVDLKPEVIAVGDPVTYTTGSSSVSLPLFTSQTAQTQVRIRNGETIAIGGLLKSSRATVEAKVPILGDIPLIGSFFKNYRRYSGGSEPVRQDLLIFLTVKLLGNAPAEGQAVAAAPSQAPY